LNVALHDVHLPLVLADESGIARANDWANGFTRGMELRKDAWADLLDGWHTNTTQTWKCVRIPSQ
jgi:hypothetical protein